MPIENRTPVLQCRHFARSLLVFGLLLLDSFHPVCRLDACNRPGGQRHDPGRHVSLCNRDMDSAGNRRAYGGVQSRYAAVGKGRGLYIGPAFLPCLVRHAGICLVDDEHAGRWLLSAPILLPPLIASYAIWAFVPRLQAAVCAEFRRRNRVVPSWRFSLSCLSRSSFTRRSPKARDTPKWAATLRRNAS